MNKHYIFFLWVHCGVPALGPNATEAADSIRARLATHCRDRKDGACENCHATAPAFLCPHAHGARASLVAGGVELILAPAGGPVLKWVLPRRARPRWRLPQHAPV